MNQNTNHESKYELKLDRDGLDLIQDASVHFPIHSDLTQSLIADKEPFRWSDWTAKDETRGWEKTQEVEQFPSNKGRGDLL